MVVSRLCVVAIGFLLTACAPASPPVDEALTAYENGRVWTGTGYEVRTLFVKGGLFVGPPDRLAGTRIDLAGTYVTPPFGEAHNHNIENPAGVPLTSKRYLELGIFYVKNPNCLPEFIPETRSLLEAPGTIDAVFAMGGITENRGHPERLYVDILSRQAYRGRTKEDFEGQAFHTIREDADIERALDTLQAQGADFVKTYLLYSEEYGARRDDDEIYGLKGLSPDRLKQVVEAAHARGLTVTTHIETAADFHNAVRAGVDEVNHLPGYAWTDGHEEETYRISDEAVADALASGIRLVTTTAVTPTNFYKDDAETLLRTQAVQADNLRRLHAAGVPIALGSDTFLATAYLEARTLQKLGAFDGRTLLNLWIDTPKLAIFPNRNISCFDPGCEASFVAMTGDPSVNIEAIETITYALKEGVAIVGGP